MITVEDIKRLKSSELKYLTTNQIRRLTNAERTCKMSTSNWAKDYWYNIFQKLCKKYGCMDYFRKVIN